MGSDQVGVVRVGGLGEQAGDGVQDDATARQIRHLGVIRTLLAILLGLAVLGALYLGRSVFLPLASAVLLSFVLRPLVRALRQIRVPAPLSALLIVAMLGSALGLGIYALKDPASQWVHEAPHSLRELRYRFETLRQPISDVQAATEALTELGSTGLEVDQVVLKERGLDDAMLVEASATAVAVFTSLIFLFFVLGWGDRLFRNLVGALPRFRNRRDLVMLAREVESSITRYLATITLINVVLGGVVGMVMYLMEMPNPVLWGVLAGTLNYIPYLGPAITAAVLAFVALLTFTNPAEALLVPGVFLIITAIEGYIITPFAVGNQLTLNPLLIFLSLVLWFWMWGVVGALLTVPILVCVKAVLDRSESGFAMARILD